MKLGSIITMFLLIGAFTLSAQTYVDIPWREGTVTKKGKEMKGMIRLGGDLNAPWLNSTKVYFVSDSDWIEGKRPKKKLITMYEPDDIDGYSTYTENDEEMREEMDFTTFEIMVQGPISKKKGNAFLRKAMTGNVDGYIYIPMPAKAISSTAEERYEAGQRAIRKATLYLQKGDGELMEASQTELVTYLSDCPDVVAKIKSEEYGFKPLSERPKRKGLGKMVATSIGDNGLESRMMKAINEYNKCTK